MQNLRLVCDIQRIRWSSRSTYLTRFQKSERKYGYIRGIYRSTLTGGPYATFAGRDASRNLATFSVVSNDKDDFDDLSDLSAVEMDSVREWEMQFKEKYELVGKLLRTGEEPTNYEDDEDDENIVNSDGTVVAQSVNVLSEQKDVLRDRQSKNVTSETEIYAKKISAVDHHNFKEDQISGSNISLSTPSTENSSLGELPITDF
ncbi:membrane steroid-binding protein 2 isoform X3 [Drosophila miranda]|uniref:membrane steroid-binding protein 2 isoform X3 n=1 Tax=Drosophila miranda TaxID=7229 RepID=UPI00143F69D5|nr:membrane steroid-binding protein 2 isoform X3 [Drosophila miranda]